MLLKVSPISFCYRVYRGWQVRPLCICLSMFAHSVNLYLCIFLFEMFGKWFHVSTWSLKQNPCRGACVLLDDLLWIHRCTDVTLFLGSRSLDLQESSWSWPKHVKNSQHLSKPISTSHWIIRYHKIIDGWGVFPSLNGVFPSLSVFSYFLLFLYMFLLFPRRPQKKLAVYFVGGACRTTRRWFLSFDMQKFTPGAVTQKVPFVRHRGGMEGWPLRSL